MKCEEWFTEEKYVDHAQEVVDGNTLRSKDGGQVRAKIFGGLTTTQIRNLLSLTAGLYDKVQQLPGENPVLNDELKSDIAYLRIQFVYNAGRDGSPNRTGVKDFVNEAQILEALKLVKDKKTLVRFCRYMESLVAYFKFNGGKDK
ncbi:MAG: type III-A CRISPR-associated protein Csm2 [Candidatus Ancillula sp.]|jgi:CRISPR-associated protein Csm2|nr:type III-A CRISPR-associated protein Csm2 [Candidatus Ancillula sp.]